MKRVVIEEKRYCIVSNAIGMGAEPPIEGKVWYEGKWKSDEHCQQLLEKAIARWEKMYHYFRPQKPELEIYWE